MAKAALKRDLGSWQGRCAQIAAAQTAAAGAGARLSTSQHLTAEICPSSSAQHQQNVIAAGASIVTHKMLWSV